MKRWATVYSIEGTEEKLSRAESDEGMAEHLLGGRKFRTWFCAKCGTFHAEGLDAAFTEHHGRQRIRDVESIDLADYRQLDHKERCGDE